MYIREIHIENIRGFDVLHLDLDRGEGTYAGWTVIAGRNGTGKSTLLKAIALSVAGPDVARQLQESFAGWVREGQPEGSILTLLESSVADWIGGEHEESTLFWTGLDLGVDPAGPQPRMNESNRKILLAPSISEPTDPAHQSHKYRGPWEANPSGWFIAGYGPHRRLGFVDGSEQPSFAKARLSSLFDENATLAEAIRWLKDIHARRLDLIERRDRLRAALPRKSDSAAARGPWRYGVPTGRGPARLPDLGELEELQRLQDSVLALLGDGLLPDGYQIVDFNMDGLWVERDGVLLALQSLSDGYRAVVALVLDIVRQMHACFPKFVVESKAGRVAVPHSGVILIDEIEAHLHVSWQKRIGSWLVEHFPNIQFIVTTHSPFICQAASPKGLIRLSAPGSGERAEHVSDELFNIVVNGSADDAVMTELFGRERPYSDAAETLREEISALESRLIQGKATKPEKAKLKKLSSKLPRNMSAEVENALRKLSVQLEAKKGG